MFIKALTLKNFRNFKKLRLEFKSPITIFTGDNGSGKTNIIEAIYVLSNIKSFRNISDSILLNKNSESYFISAEVSDTFYSGISIGYSQQTNNVKKKFKIDNNTVTKSSDYYGSLLTVVICPSDLNIIESSPDLRRRYFDSVISKTDKSYFDNLNDLKKIIHYRNILLKEINESPQKKIRELDTWDSLLSEKSIEICSKRKSFIENYNLSFKKFYKKISNEDDIPLIKYNSVFFDKGLNEIYAIIKYNRSMDFKKGYTHSGPHRDDFKFTINDSVLRYTASQGQKRTAVISLKLSEMELIESITGKKPVILIDDIFSELDNKRRSNLIKLLVNENQLFFTMVDASIIENVITKEYQKFEVDSFN